MRLCVAAAASQLEHVYDVLRCAVTHSIPQKDVHTGKEHLEVAFEFRKMRFVYNEATNAFERLKFPVHEPFEYYLKATGGSGFSLQGDMCLCVF
jgi:hypothetical protein